MANRKLDTSNRSTKIGVRSSSFIYGKQTLSKHRPVQTSEPIVEKQDRVFSAAKQEMIDRLMTNAKEWNQWRIDNKDAVIDLDDTDLRNVNLCSYNLRGARLNNADLRGAELYGSDLSDASLWGANLNGIGDRTDLRGADLRGADFLGADLRQTDFGMANPRGEGTGTNLSYADFKLAYLDGADLSGADITGTGFRGASLMGADVRGVIYDRKLMDGNYRGIRIDGCYGDAVFKRDAQDQDYIDTLEPRCRRGWRKLLFSWWRFTDYGRSIPSVALVAITCMIAFGCLFYIPGVTTHTTKGFDITPLYFSIVTFTTLGYGDVSANNTFGQCLVAVEVALGYITLGLLLAILANTVARRS